MPTITIPGNALIVLIGAAASGKSSFAARHFAASEIVSSDVCRQMVSDDMTNQECSPLAFELFHLWIKQRLQLRRLTIADATNVKRSAREKLIALATEAGVPAVAVTLATPLDECLAWNATRSRRVPEDVIRRQYTQDAEPRDLFAEGFARHIIVLPDSTYRIERASETLLANTVSAPAFDVIGDVHGCVQELFDLLRRLGYTWSQTAMGPVHPDGRKLVFVGDFVDRGPFNWHTLNVVKRAVAVGHKAVMGNHDNKLLRALKGNKVKIGEALALTIEQLTAMNDARADTIGFLESLPYQLRLVTPGMPDVYVCHAGMPRHMIGRTDKAANAHCIYGEVHGFDEATGFPKRGYSWHGTWTAGPEDPILVHGHDVVPEPWPQRFVNVVNVDQGCVFGGKLTAFRYPECEFVQVGARKVYAAREGTRHAA
jgi:protein phosphatase